MQDKAMKKFLAIYTGSASAMTEWKSMDAGEREKKEKAGVAAWKEWVTANQSSIVDPGTPLGKTKQISAKGISDIHNNMTAYTIVQAESHEAAARLFEKHPHFTIFPGDAVEVMECLPLPEM
jgi:leucyl aminopeptidase (aminopeptidase T)